jgi:hypothetical protein
MLQEMEISKSQEENVDNGDISEHTITSSTTVEIRGTAQLAKVMFQ